MQENLSEIREREIDGKYVKDWKQKQEVFSGDMFFYVGEES